MDKVTQRGKKSNDEGDEILDEDEQNSIIEALKDQDEHQNKLWRNSFFAISILLAIGKIYCALFPFSIPPHFVFTGEVDSITISATELTSALFFIVTGIYVKRISKYGPTVFFCSNIMAAVGLVVWGISWTDYPYQLTWFYGVNAIFSGICFYTDKSLSGTREEIDKLNQYRYKYKKV